MKRAILAALLAGTVGGCALADRVQSRSDYRESAAQYKACLANNPPQACESQRLAMEADERRFTNMGAAMEGRQGAANVTVLNR